jgi:hypothetical protein
MLSNKFLDYLAAVHEAASEEIKRILQRQGGYVMCLDGTCEAGTDVLFSVFDGLSELVLVSGRMKTENSAEIKSLVDRCIACFGMPLATVRDLSENVRLGRDHLPEQVRDLLCDYHFLENVGEKLQDRHHRLLTQIMTKHKIRSRLRSLRKDMVKASKANEPISAKAFAELMDEPGKVGRFEPVQLRRRLAHLVMTWIAKSNSDLGGQRPPFSLPALAFYNRCVRAYDFLDTVLGSVDMPRQHKRTLTTVHAILSPVRSDQLLVAAAKRLQLAQDQFNALRRVLRFTAPQQPRISRRQAPLPDRKLARRRRQRLGEFTAQLRRRAEDRQQKEGAEDARIVLGYLDKYWYGLHGHLIEAPAEPGKEVLAPRTNHIAERHFGRIKRGWRRRLGTATLTRRQQAAKPEELLVTNLENDDYLTAVYGGDLATMPQRFADNHPAAITKRKSRTQQDDPRMHTYNKTIGDENLFTKIGRVISALAASVI